jgi:hypothetical protein
MREQSDRAAGIAKVAEAAPIEKANEIAFDIEQMIYEVNTFLDAASMINRIRKT